MVPDLVEPVTTLPGYPAPGLFYGSGGGGRRRPVELSVLALDTSSLTLIALSNNNESIAAPLNQIMVTNTSNSLTALNVASHFEGTALEGKIEETTNTCESIAPGQTCILGYTPKNMPVSQTSFSIFGSNTEPVTASIRIVQQPLLHSITPNFGPDAGGTVITLTGVGLGEATGVTLDNLEATSFSVVNETTITATTPAHAAGPVDVSVNTPFGTPIFFGGFTYEHTTISLTGSPLLLEVNGFPGIFTVANVTATNIAPDFLNTPLDQNVIVLNNTCATVAPLQNCTITIAPQSNTVAETNFPIQGDNTNSVSAAIAIRVPSINSVSPDSGPGSGGTEVTIVGSGFMGTIGVEFGSDPAASFTVESDTSIKAITPPHTLGTVGVRVITVANMATLPFAFTFLFGQTGEEIPQR